MPGMRVTEGARQPLFDRLAESPAESIDTRGPLGVLDRAGLYASLQRELERLLNTRSPHTAGALAPAERSVIDYGLPDYSQMYTRSREDQKKLAELVRRTIEAFEPRLSQVRVEAEVLGDSDKALLVKVAGVLAFGPVTERVSFAVHASGEGLRGAGLGS